MARTILLLDKNVEGELVALRKYAEEHPFTVEDIKAIKAGTMPIAGDRPEHVVFVPFDMKVVLSVSYNDIMKVRQLSVSRANGEKLPSVFEVELLLPLLGFDGSIIDMDEVHPEEFAPGRTAINILQIIK